MAKATNTNGKEKEFNINDYKDQIDKYIKERVEKEASGNAVKYYKKKVRNKNIAIFIEFIIIVALLCAGAAGLYFFYNEGCLGTIHYERKDNSSQNNNSNENNNTENKDDDKKKLDNLISKYSYLLDNVNIDTKSDYLTEYYSGNLTNELKEYLSYQLINKNNIISDSNSSYFDAELLLNSYKNLFGNNIEFTDFKYNGASYKYLKNKEMFISTSLSTEGNKIIKEITNIEESDNKVIITTTEGYIKDDKLYNVLSNKEITDYKKDDKISKYTKKLNTVKYTFSNEYLESIK